MQAIAATDKNVAAEAAKASAPQPRLVRAAHEFEAQMMKELLKPNDWQRRASGDEDSSKGIGVRTVQW